MQHTKQQQAKQNKTKKKQNMDNEKKYPFSHYIIFVNRRSFVKVYNFC